MPKRPPRQQTKRQKKTAAMIEIILYLIIPTLFIILTKITR